MRILLFPWLSEEAVGQTGQMVGGVGRHGAHVTSLQQILWFSILRRSLGLYHFLVNTAATVPKNYGYSLSVQPFYETYSLVCYVFITYRNDV